MDPLILLPIAAFIALVLGVVVVLGRTARVLADTRELDEFRRAATDLAARVDGSLEAVTERVDLVRRHRLPPASARESLEAALEAMALYGSEAESLRPPAALGDLRAAIVEETARAGRALELIVHGCELLDEGSSRIGDLQGQTAIKRGYLNLLHARDAIAATAREANRSNVPRGERWLSWRRD